MENIKKFINSIYLGDRFCEKFQINCISRLKDGTKKWNYYSEEDIEHGCIVFDDVSGYCWSKKLPFNDEIYEIEIIEKKIRYILL